jgi:hypothetical protein
MSDEERIDLIIKAHENIARILLNFHIALSGVQLEVNALKAIVCPDKTSKDRLAEQILASAGSLGSVHQKIQTSLQKHTEELKALHRKPETIN